MITTCKMSLVALTFWLSVAGAAPVAVHRPVLALPDFRSHSPQYVIGQAGGRAHAGFWLPTRNEQYDALRLDLGKTQALVATSRLICKSILHVLFRFGVPVYFNLRNYFFYAKNT